MISEEVSIFGKNFEEFGHFLPETNMYDLVSFTSHAFLQVGLIWSGWANQIWYRRPFYERIYEIIYKRDTKWYYLKYYLIISFSLILSVRAFILTFREDVMEWTVYDGRQFSAMVFVDEIFGRDDGNIAFFTLIHAFFFIFNAANQGFFHFTRTDSAVWEMFVDIVLRNFHYCQKASEKMTTYKRRILISQEFAHVKRSMLGRCLPLMFKNMIVQFRLWFSQELLDKEYLLEQKFILFSDFFNYLQRKFRVLGNFLKRQPIF